MIINPVTKQRVHLHSTEGNQVFRNYLQKLDQLQNGGSGSRIKQFLQKKMNS